MKPLDVESPCKHIKAYLALQVSAGSLVVNSDLFQLVISPLGEMGHDNSDSQQIETDVLGSIYTIIVKQSKMELQLRSLGFLLIFTRSMQVQ